MLSFFRSVISATFGKKSAKVYPDPDSSTRTANTEAFEGLELHEKLNRELDGIRQDFVAEVEKLKSEISKKFFFRPSLRALKKYSLAHLDEIKNMQVSKTGYVKDELEKMRDNLAGNTNLSDAYKRLESIVMKTNEREIEHQEKVQKIIREKAVERQKELKSKPFKHQEKVQNNNGVTTTLSAEEVSLKLQNLAAGLAKQYYYTLEKKGDFTSNFLQNKISNVEFADIKNTLTSFLSDPKNIAQVTEQIKQRGYFSIKKFGGELGDYNISLDKLPRSVILTQHNGEIQMTILTKTKVAGNEVNTKDSSARIRGGNSAVTRALAFTTTPNNDLNLGTVIHKTPNKKSVSKQEMERWYTQAATDPIDQARKAPRGMLVADGGVDMFVKAVDPISQTSIPVLNPELKQDDRKLDMVQNLFHAATMLPYFHADIKAQNILVSSTGNIRIIDLPIDPYKTMQQIQDQTHFSEGFKAKSFADIIQEIPDPLNFSRGVIEHTPGTSTFNFIDAGDEFLSGFNGKTLADIGLDRELNEGLKNNLDVIAVLSDSFFMKGAMSSIPEYHDSWGLLQTAEELYNNIEGKLSFADQVGLELVNSIKRDMIKDFVNYANDIPKEKIAEVAELNNQISSLDYELGSIFKQLHNQKLSSEEKQRSILQNIPEEKRLEFNELVGNEELFSAKLQDHLQDIIARKDEAFAQLNELLDQSEFKNLAENMNKKWSPKALAEQVGAGEFKEQEKEQKQYHISEEVKSEVTQLGQNIIAIKEKVNANESNSSYNSVTQIAEIEGQKKKSKSVSAVEVKNPHPNTTPQSHNL